MVKKATLLVLFGSMLALAANAQISVLGTLTRYQESVPGAEYEGTVSLKNTGAESAQAKVYVRDYSFNADGQTEYGDPGTLPRSNAGWITVSTSTAVLAPGEVADIKYSVNVPSTGILAGTYWSIIFVEGIPVEAEAPESDAPLISIRQVMRYGVQIVSDFVYAGKSELKFSNTRILTGEKGRTFSVDLSNTGSRWLNGDAYIEVYSLDGDRLSTLGASKFRTYPGTSVRKSFSLEAFPAGTYKALLVADCGGDDLFGGNYNLVIAE